MSREGIDLDTKAMLDALGKMSDDMVNRVAPMALSRAGLVVERATKLKLTESGRHKKGTKTPAAVGSPPAIVTGALRRSVKTFKPERVGFRSYRVLVGPTVVYGRFQELGEGVPVRPFLGPAMESVRYQVRQELVDVIGRFA